MVHYAFDRASARSFDSDGRLHLDSSHISKAVVNPYWGEEINAAMKDSPNWKPLDPKHKYWLLRDPEELKKGAKTFNNIPILKKHVPMDAESYDPDWVIGSTGTDAVFNKPYLDNSLVFWAKSAIDDINSGKRRQLSSAYRYVAVMEPGNYEGTHFDGKMTQIVGNHVATVEEGRAGPTVAVGDSQFDYSLEWKNLERALLSL